MKILVCNDDGIHAAGLRALCTVLISAGHDIYVVAPDKERSASGHSLTLHRPLRVDIIPLDYFLGAKKIWTVDGTPADCVKIAINEILDFKPDWVVSGINHGPNMGSDVLYSGTVGAAIEGAIYNIKSMALSVSEYKTKDFEEEASFVPEILNKLNSPQISWTPKTIFNVNLPIIERSKVKGYAITSLGERMYKDTYEQRIDPRSKYYYWLSGDLLKTDEDPESDVRRVAENYISITPISFDMTHYKLVSELKDKFNNI